MTRKRKMTIVSSLLLVGSICWGYFYVFHGEHRNIAEEMATAEFQAAELLYQFTHSGADKATFADKVIKVTGNISSIDQNTIVLNGMVQVDLVLAPNTTIQNGRSITVKGRCVGYDDLLEVVKIDQATQITK